MSLASKGFELFKKICLASLALPMSLGFSQSQLEPDLKTYHEKVQPIVKKYCVECHGEKKSKGKIRLDNISPDIIKGEHGGVWEDAMEQFYTGEMPPDDELQPTNEEREILTAWLDGEFKKASLVGRADKKGEIRRLTRYELKHTLEDLLNVSVSHEIEELPEESQSSESGLKNTSSLLMVSGPYIESYLDTIFSTIDKTKQILNYESFAVNYKMAEIELTEARFLYSEDNETAKPEEKKKKAKKKAETKKVKPPKKEKAPFSRVEKTSEGLLVRPNGYVTLNFPKLPQGAFEVPVKLKTIRAEGELALQIGFKYSDTDRREVVEEYDFVQLENQDGVQSILFSGFMDRLSETITRSFGREYFIRLYNKSSGSLLLEEVDFIGNVSREIKEAVLGKSNTTSLVDSEVKSLLSSFVNNAFRRTPSKNELSKYFNIYKNFSKEESNVSALLSTYEEILCSPSFLYLGIPSELNDLQKENFLLAEKLSYFLWSSMPDEELLSEAAKGNLTKDEVLKKHIKRMLRDDKAKRLVENFTDQCLDTEKLFNVAVDTSYYKGFKDDLKTSMRQETVESINDVFRNGSSALNLLKADHVFVNESLAKFYNIKGVKGSEVRKVEIDEKINRGGLLTQATFLIGNSDGINSHAILRGVWLTDIILDDPPPEPPKNVPPFDETIPGFDKMTLNQKLEAHRNHDACRSCHNRIDPWGVAFENYDASGAWRDKVLIITKEGKGKRQKIVKDFLEIEQGSVLPTKHKVNGMKDLKNYLLEHKQEDFAKGLTKNILSYALSRDVDFYDKALVEDLKQKFMKDNFSVATLIEEIVLSEAFRKGNS